MAKTTKQKVAIGAGILGGLAALGLVLKNVFGAPPTEIQLSNLIISPDVINPGTEVSISATAKNKSNAVLSATIELYIGGVLMAQKTVTLDPGQSQVVAFTFTPTQVGSYNVSVDGLTGSFMCTEVADIRTSDLIITPDECYIGETVQISVIATNYGTVRGSKTITCEVS
jgi:hypothetical protein